MEKLRKFLLIIARWLRLWATPKGLKLSDILKAVQYSVEEAKKISDEQHHRQLKRYFNEDGTPLTTRVKLPVYTSGLEISWRDVDIPLISLVPPTSIQMSEIEMEMKFKRGEIALDILSHPDFYINLEHPESDEGSMNIIKIVYHSQGNNKLHSLSESVLDNLSLK